MTYSLNNNCTKNYYNWTLTVQVIVEDMDFFETQWSAYYSAQMQYKSRAVKNRLTNVKSWSKSNF